MNLQKYVDAPTKGTKGAVVMHVVWLLTEQVGARFVKEEGDHYVTIDKKGIREKVAHAMRDMSTKQQQEGKGGKKKLSSSMKKIRSLKRNSRQSTSSLFLPKTLKPNDEGEEEVCVLKSSLEQQQDDMKFESLISNTALLADVVDVSSLGKEMIALNEDYDFTSFTSFNKGDDDDCTKIERGALKGCRTPASAR